MNFVRSFFRAAENLPARNDDDDDENHHSKACCCGLLCKKRVILFPQITFALPATWQSILCVRYGIQGRKCTSAFFATKRQNWNETKTRVYLYLFLNTSLTLFNCIDLHIVRQLINLHEEFSLSHPLPQQHHHHNRSQINSLIT
mmetsp:Transcript_26350/g.38562  ORF Transcript_26350/g.38562 Transcript_26350/m.38562 type:complete len:144 (-) Transcript_26350:504-935(-)